MDDCLGVDCNSGQCIDDIDSYSCQCEAGYTGESYFGQNSESN